MGKGIVSFLPYWGISWLLCYEPGSLCSALNNIADMFCRCLRDSTDQPMSHQLKLVLRGSFKYNSKMCSSSCVKIPSNSCLSRRTQWHLAFMASPPTSQGGGGPPNTEDGGCVPVSVCCAAGTCVLLCIHVHIRVGATLQALNADLVSTGYNFCNFLICILNFRCGGGWKEGEGEFGG